MDCTVFSQKNGALSAAWLLENNTLDNWIIGQNFVSLEICILVAKKE